MSLIKDPQGKVQKLDYLFPYLPIFLPLCRNIDIYNSYP